MIKRTLLTSVFLFVPLVASWAEDTLVIGSEQSLTEKNLPLVYEFMDEAYQTSVVSKGCLSKRSVLEEFVDHLSVPFSARDLLEVCKRTIKADPMFYGEHYGETKARDCKVKLCPQFVVNYVKDISKYHVDSKNMPFDEEVFDRVIINYGDYCYTKDFKTKIRRLNLEGKEYFEIPELLGLCESYVQNCNKECPNIIYDYGTQIKDFKETQREIDRQRKSIGVSSAIISGSEACLQANNFRVSLNFKECGSYVNVANGYSKDETAGNIWGQCKRWYEVAEKCQAHLLAVYTEKLDYLQTKREIEQYRCVINKIQTGQMYFPFDEAELLKSCE